MSQKLYVGNLPFSASEEDIRDVFSAVCAVEEIKLITDRDTGRSRGFAFVTVDNGQEAIAQLNGRELGGRALTINEAREKSSGGSDRYRDGGQSHGGRNKNYSRNDY